jgi:ELWxxDGT repeat protein
MNVNFFPKRLLRKLRNRPTAWRESTNDRLDGFETLEDRVLLSGTPQLVADILPGVGSSRPIRATYVNSTLFFQANDGTTGGELWKSDGTNAGTVLVKDIQPGIASSNPSKSTPLIVGQIGIL